MWAIRTISMDLAVWDKVKKTESEFGGDVSSEQINDLKDAVEGTLNNMLPQFTGGDPMAVVTTAMEADIGYVDLPDGRTARIVLTVEIDEG